MKDSFGRNIEYLRLSVTERCTLKCDYCRSEYCSKNDKKELSTEEFIRIVSVCEKLGIKKLRLTGGEPLLRSDIIELVKGFSSSGGIRELVLTTNAQQLGGLAKKLKSAGLTRINISMDSLRPQRFREITGGGDVQMVLAAIDEAIEAGLLPVKINMVVIRGRNDDEIDDFISLAKDRPVDVRFIELMPIGKYGEDASRRVSSDEIINSRPFLLPVQPRYPEQASSDYTIEGYTGRLGFISAVSHKFCANCNRIRIMSDGMLRPCLGNNSEVSLRESLARGDQELYDTIKKAIFEKPQGHNFEDGFCSEKNMSRIGG